jgi:uncharacterized iron-regulated protein
MRAGVAFLIAISALLAQNGPAQNGIDAQHYRVYRGDGRASSLEELIRESNAAAVTFLGEQHDDPVAHYLEEQILRQGSQADVALSLEMFETDVQQVVDEYLAGLVTEEHFLASGRAWKNYKTDYRPLVEHAKERKMRVIAANPPRRYVNRVTRLGAASLGDLDSAAKALLPPLPYAKASDRYAEKFRKVMEEARREQLDPAKGIQAQSLWDAGMAFSIAEFLSRNPGMRVLQCNGSFHSAERLGIPEHLARYRPGASMVVVTMVPGKSFPDFDAEKMKGQGDFVIVTDPKAPRSSGAATAATAK